MFCIEQAGSLRAQVWSSSGMLRSHGEKSLPKSSLPSPSSFASLLRTTQHRAAPFCLLIPFPYGKSISRFHSAPQPLTAPPRPPKLLNRRGAVRQVSQCGKPQCTAPPKKLCVFHVPLNLPVGFAPLEPPPRFSTSGHRSRRPGFGPRKSSTG